MNCTFVNPVEDPRWDEFVNRHPMGSIFNHSRWNEVLVKTFQHAIPLHCIAEDDNGKIHGILSVLHQKSLIKGKRFISLPLTFYCDPLVDSDDIFPLLLEALVNTQKKYGVSSIEIRTRLAAESLRKSAFMEVVRYKNHTLDLEPDLEILKKNFHRSCIRQHINKAEQFGFQVRNASQESDVKEFYRLYCLTRKKFGVPPQPYSYFRNIWDILHPVNMAGILTAYDKDHPVCSMLYFRFGKQMLAESMGMNEDYKSHSPNILLFWKAIQQAKEQGFRQFDFGGTPVQHVHLMDFKRRWGTVEDEIAYFYYPDVKGFSAKSDHSIRTVVFNQLCKSMPLSLFKWTGKTIYHFLDN